MEGLVLISEGLVSVSDGRFSVLVLVSDFEAETPSLLTRDKIHQQEVVLFYLHCWPPPQGSLRPKTPQPKIGGRSTGNPTSDSTGHSHLSLCSYSACIIQGQKFVECCTNPFRFLQNKLGEPFYSPPFSVCATSKYYKNLL